jgi:hypothetical protein
MWSPRVLAVAVALCSCTHQPAPGESIAEVCRAENHKKTVTASGYLVPPAVTLGCEQSCSMYLAPRRNEQEGVWVTFEVGTGPRTMNRIAALKNGFEGQVERLSASDFVLRDDSGKEVGPNDVVRVTGQLWYSAESPLGCSIQKPTSVSEL